jgi:hypothetical protein
MKKTIFNVSALTALLTPALAFAQTPNFNYIDSTISAGEGWLGEAVTILMILMTIFFLYSVLRFIMNKDAAKSAELRSLMINGLIGLFVAVGVWGIIHLAGNITGVNTTNPTTQSSITCPPGFDQVNGLCQPTH